MPSLLRRLVAPLALAATLGCGTVDPTSSLLGIEFANLQTGVPLIGWSASGGNMNFIQLTTQSDQNTILWRLETPGADGLLPPLVYGSRPDSLGNVVRTGSLPTLERGVEYRVTIRRLDGLGGTGRIRLP